ncbi:Crp/Fnr family transcriptional regulator [Tenacibaculum maritimum]|uniref:Crp/Fnr family transcriptional regulator n=1 Tax=Tenacibaculum maritimum TaxID=107401 RepID=UPI001E30D92B|nr:Crp/Fnr family transcriptional regulator [Tenacibaculum maritimum]MCD9584848.1 Crp/Fnr family transcriptional regulator [Tenacibaculum maritimum]MCD9610113.1 Crp/Fnr family transcriptional regulator [Tenacibaculum maritimum]MCD9620704.1 Crp/Fnr family transcriptional regulator [Tenacibaculum maritimum]MCD9626955.1 Crp/Fnr family transcriptional regulator [Tenacibaculum maritimum]MCD9630570.1 Crp/Fnr family transcriptional regulator [Tenacibaculum maritimum]
MLNVIVSYIARYIELNKEEIEVIKDLIRIEVFKKGTLLLKKGEVAESYYFNVKGCIRLYYMVNGEEKTTFFYTENQFVSSIKSFTRQVPSNHFFECEEDCILGVLSYEAEKKLLRKFPKFEQLYKVILEEQLSHYQEVLSSFITTKPEERYKSFFKSHPALVQRIPQYKLASYLGIAPESLSRIKRRIAEQNSSKDV